jgi:hypothetical protein
LPSLLPLGFGLVLAPQLLVEGRNTLSIRWRQAVFLAEIQVSAATCENKAAP